MRILIKVLMKALIKALIKVMFATACLASANAWAKVDVFACEPEWAALAEEIGGNKVDTFSATTAFQDPHFIQARPSLIARLRRANLVICSGAGLEIGWLPVLLRQAGNASVNVGSSGFVDASSAVRMRDVPVSADRSVGDLHPYGNPHFVTDARNIPLVAALVLARLKLVDGANADYYQARFDDFDRRWQEALKRWQGQAQGLKGMPIVVQHAAWTYMEDWLGLAEIGQMEPKPGLPPTASHLAELLAKVKSQPVKAFVRASYQAPKAADWLSERTGVPAVVVPHTIGATDNAKDLFGMFDDMVRVLLEVNQ